MPAQAPKTPCKASAAVTVTPVSLLTYLRDFKPEVPDIATSVTPGTNTRSSSGDYVFKDITESVPIWEEFNLATLRRWYEEILKTPVNERVVEVSPQKKRSDIALKCEGNVVEFVGRSITLQLNRAFKSLFKSRTLPNKMVDRHGGSDQSSADRVGILYPAGQLRLVGEIKVSWKWSSTWRTAKPDTVESTEFRQVLSQVHYYMNVHGTRYGYVLTDREFVAIKRVGEQFGDIMISKAVRWRGGGCGGMSLALASWFLHKLAAEETGWDAPYCPRSAAKDLLDEEVLAMGASTRKRDGPKERTRDVKENGPGEKRVGLRKSPRLHAGSKKPPDGKT